MIKKYQFAITVLEKSKINTVFSTIFFFLKKYMDQDWKPVIIRGRGIKKKEKEIKEMREGTIEVQKRKKLDLHKFKIENETEELSHKKIDVDTGKQIMQARQAKGWTQKELAQKLNVKSAVINDYENGRGILDRLLLNRIKNILGIK